MTVYYPGQLSDNGVMNIVCSDYNNACYGIEIYADNVDQIKMSCIGGSSVSSSSYAVCEQSRLNATYSNNVTIIIQERYATYSSDFWVQHAGKVVLDAKEGYYGFYISRLYADEADEVIIYAQSFSSVNYPLRSSSLYVGEQAEFHCYGYGCLDLNDINRYLYLFAYLFI